MNKIFITSYLFVLLFISNQVSAQQQFFKDAAESVFKNAVQKRVIIPTRYRTIALNDANFKNFIKDIPVEHASKNNVTLDIPMPDGTTNKFTVWEVSIMEPALAANFSSIKTFRGKGIDDPTATLSFDYTEFGFHAMILSPVTGSVFIDPYYQQKNDYYISYFKKDFSKFMYPELSPIKFDGILNKPTSIEAVVAVGPCRGTQLFTYRLAVACTHEYAIAATGLATPTVAQTLAKIVTSVNRVDGVYEKEVAVRLILVATENNIIFPTLVGDPFTGNNNANTLITESQTQIDTRIGTANYDVGHTFSTGAGGLAGLGVVCVAGNKARGVTGSSVPVGDGYDIDYVAHEIGHQFGGNHTFNSTTSSCGGGNRNAGTAYEVGSGTSIMAYAGICTTDDTQLNSDPFFHTVSFDEISTLIATGSGANCKVAIATNNTIPVITSMSNNGVSIPVSTPFTLIGSATDADGNASLTYCWEEWDLGTAGAWNNGAANTTSPLFKSRTPKTVGYRNFPDMAVIVAGYPAAPAATLGGLKGETLCSVARTMKFRLTVRDNNANGGGVVTGGNGCQTNVGTVFQIKTVVPAGPGIWSVTVPNGGENWLGNSSQTVTWNVAGTTAAPISCTNVNILMSLDGGLNYYDTILVNTLNDGSEIITVPNITTTNTVRFRVECANNVFFDISNANFTITAAANPKYITQANGNWNTAATWLSNVIPPITADCIVRHNVTVTADVTCKSLKMEKYPAGVVTIITTKKLTVTN
jgi:Metallo-peptidase family M12B Reprolysin-like